jgi:hypothetical protein
MIIIRSLIIQLSQLVSVRNPILVDMKLNNNQGRQMKKFVIN